MKQYYHYQDFYKPTSYLYTENQRQKRRSKIINMILIGLIVLLNCILMILIYILGTLHKSSDFQSWNLQKEYPVIRIYSGGSRYESLIYQAVGKYNTLVPIFAITDSPENADVVCYDFEEAMDDVGTLGVTESNGRIGFNTYLLKTKSDQIILSVIMHELGHAIGLKHNEEPYSIMNSEYNPVTFTDKDIQRIKTIWNQSFE